MNQLKTKLISALGILFNREAKSAYIVTKVIYTKTNDPDKTLMDTETRFIGDISDRDAALILADNAQALEQDLITKNMSKPMVDFAPGTKKPSPRQQTLINILNAADTIEAYEVSQAALDALKQYSR
jgi:hypothetical protein